MKDSGFAILLILILLCFCTQKEPRIGFDKPEKCFDKNKKPDHDDCEAPNFMSGNKYNGMPNDMDGFQRFDYNGFNPDNSYAPRNDFGLLK